MYSFNLKVLHFPKKRQISTNISGKIQQIEPSADAQKGILAKAGKNGRLCFVYEKSDGYVVAIDIKNAIECGSFTGARTSQCYVEGTVEKLYIAKFDEDRDNNGNLVPPYETVFVLEKTKDGKERSINMVMPCEDEK